MSRLCFLLASPAKDQMEQKFRIKNTVRGILMPLFAGSVGEESV